MRRAMRVGHYSIRTEEAYLDWAFRFIQFHKMRHPAQMGAPEITEFLTHLAVAGRAATGATGDGLESPVPMDCDCLNRRREIEHDFDCRPSTIQGASIAALALAIQSHRQWHPKTDHSRRHVPIDRSTDSVTAPRDHREGKVRETVTVEPSSQDHWQLKAAASATQNRLCDVEMCLQFNLADSAIPPT
jgi:hypothetical protein